MLRLLFDAHFGPRDVEAMLALDPAIDVISLQAWEEGAFLEQDDALILAEACRQARTLVTRDMRTITPLIKEWAEHGIAHGGVIFVDNRSFPEGNVGSVARALVLWCQNQADDDWSNTVHYLRAVANSDHREDGLLSLRSSRESAMTW